MRDVVVVDPEQIRGIDAGNSGMKLASEGHCVLCVLWLERQESMEKSTKSERRIGGNERIRNEGGGGFAPYGVSMLLVLL